MSFPTTGAVSSQAVAGAAQTRPLVLNEGQLFHGQIKQLFPGQMAEVQIGGQRLFAKLEVPMKAGDSYYFQVSSVKPELQLKIISGPLQSNEGQVRQLSGLMDAMQLPKTQEMQSLLTFVMKKRIPITREGLLEAETILKGVSPAARIEALASIQKMIELKLPLTKRIFQSLVGVETKEGLHTVLTSLKNALAMDDKVMPHVKDTILSALEKVDKPFIRATGGALLGQSLLTLLDGSEPPETRFATLQLLKSVAVLPERSSLANLQQVLTSLLTTDSTIRPANTAPAPEQNVPVGQQLLWALKHVGDAPQGQMKVPLENIRALISSDKGMNTQQKIALTEIVNRVLTMQPATDSTTKFIQEFTQAYTRIAASNAVAAPFSLTTSAEGPIERLLTVLGQHGTDKLEMLMRTAERSDNSTIQQAVRTAEAVVSKMIDGTAVKDALQTVTRSFGLNYEAGLLGKETDFGRLAETLKPQLLTLMHNPSISPALREAADTVVMRMNGPLLQSGENGVQHQLVMQVPLEFFGKRIDATLHWNSRMKKDGKMDSRFARILFYLDFESIKNTVIDMQVQNRIVSVTVFNADETLKIIGDPLQQRLKEGLESTGYKLSGVFFKKFEEEEKNTAKQKNFPKTDRTGVDFRV
ncbi:MAG: hypothetical protein ABS920_00155 [Sporosarcina sp.]